MRKFLSLLPTLCLACTTMIDYSGTAKETYCQKNWGATNWNK